QLAKLKEAKESKESTDATEIEARKATLVDDLKELGAAPAPFEVAVKLTPVNTPTASIGAELVQRGPQLFVVVEAGDRTGEATLDEVKLLPAAQKSGGKH